ncbi:MAG: hypothetical protein EBR09_02540 [Proteobacteria bacterium]|nr:hypothetical protein [Pseudomonadota bacterium]
MRQIISFIIGFFAVWSPVYAAPSGDEISLAAGNVLSISSDSESQLNSTIELDWSGIASVPLCGSISLLNLSLQDAHATLSRCLNKFYRKIPDFRLSPVTPRLFAVKAGRRNEKMNIVKVAQGTSVNSVLASAVSAPESNAVIRLISPFGLDLVHPAGAADWSVPFRWRGGESLIIETPATSKSALSIDVLGEVKKVGRFEFKASQSILSIIREAQGLTSAADPEAVTVIRSTSGQKIKSDWDDQNIRIEPGDVIFVPAKSEHGFEKSIRWTGSLLAVINTFFLVILTRKR